MENMPEFTLHRPDTAAEAVKLKSSDSTSRYLAGGTDMIVNVRRGIETPETMIDLTAIADIAAIATDGDGLRIGAGAKLADLAVDETIIREYPAVAQAAASVAGPTHRAYGTIGGNLCLDTRCLFYNQSQWWRESNNFCLKHKGDVCHVAPGGKRCFAAFSGDVAPAMMVYEAKIDLEGPNGSRTIPLADLYRNDGMDHLTLEQDELLVSIRLPKAGPGAVSAYEKSRVRGSIDFPLAGCAVRLTEDDGKIADLRIALTAVNPYPQMVNGLADFIGKALDDDALDAIRELVQKQAKPMRTTTVRPWYRRRVVGALARKLTVRLAG
ncbi:MAG TPA: 4-hydroxybenzoyl-CoA reductase subunit beta [Rhodospirillaceae bacterium]|nr:4-hydroxybenzoyl-CoA reductase subunit beta [Rhodospirillaceae bacterium]|tara:strand:+ start:1224 stop:2198 length:975 start_codon:yes stop_codon:yes gene_type:complete